jgi:hypothetical protein
MKPLILWARDKHPDPYLLRIGERNDAVVAGSVKIDDAWHPFSYDRQTLTITVGEGETARIVRVNEWGWEQ